MWGLLKTQHRHITYYTGPETAHDEIRKMLLRSPGGQVDLIQNEDTGIATLCLNHPDKRNAISGKMMVDLENAINALETWESGKGLIVYGNGQTFCSGGDLNMARMFCNPDDGFRMATYMQHVLGRLQRLPLLTAALIEGTGALGGGSEIAVSCDFRLFANNTAGIGFVHSRMGIVPAWGGCTRLVSIVGYNRALDLMAYRTRGGRTRSSGHRTMRRRGKQSSRSTRVAQVSFRGDVQVIRALKAICFNATTISCSESLAHEKRIFAPLWGGPANLTALSKNIKHK
ncbi:hypothetical protein L9F63_008576 [Diploptera punctata]|uniref:Ethylmalonyl-CoA decarboxylase n=1 Tax=Diploptera punctata TaxID=6984 RepID=A0AAD7Z5F8_DIPPU|nr:hypothetical protein L9F63_008576 [Diploptera punctata]